MIRIAIIQFPGSNCETESIAAVRRAGMEPVEFLWNQSYALLHQFDGYVIVGGFSYEDRSRAGVIASLDPVMDIIRKEAATGKPVLGICNGAQILVETGMVPGLENYKIGMALAPNRREKDGHILGTGFYNVFAHLKLACPPGRTAFTRRLKEGDTLYIPLAHAEGRHVIPEALLKEMITHGQTPFRYSDAAGNVVNRFPVNPNGSVYNLAAVSNPAGNVMAIMPHPERVPAGDPIFASMKDYIEEGMPPAQSHCRFAAPPLEIGRYKRKAGAFELPINLLITDNTAHSVHKALEMAGLKAGITRKAHWEVQLESPEDSLKEAIIRSGELFNSNKEYVTEIPGDSSKVRILIRDKEDLVGKQKRETLTDRFHLEGITHIKRSTLWEIELEDPEDQESLQRIFNTHILWNPYFQDALFYTT